MISHQTESRISTKPNRTCYEQEATVWLSCLLILRSLFIILLSHRSSCLYQTAWMPPSVSCWGFAFARIILFVMVLPNIFAWLAQMYQLYRQVFPDCKTSGSPRYYLIDYPILLHLLLSKIFFFINLFSFYIFPLVSKMQVPYAEC